MRRRRRSGRRIRPARPASLELRFRSSNVLSGASKGEARHRAEAGILDRAGGGRGLPVHVPGSRSCRFRIISRQASLVPPKQTSSGSSFASTGPDHRFLQPAHQRQVVTMTAEEGHRGVGVAIDQGGEDAAAGVQRFQARIRGGR